MDLHPERRADAIFVLGGGAYERYPYALELALLDFAPRVVMSNPRGSRDIWMTDLCGSQRYDFPITCFEPTPSTTRGEAQELRRLAHLYGWKRVIVVTSVPHISRARFILDRCFDGELVMASSPEDISRTGRGPTRTRPPATCAPSRTRGAEVRAADGRGSRC